MRIKRRTYLDYASGFLGNASSPTVEGSAARTRLEEARRKIARLVEVKSDDVIFTSGATESNALAIHGVVRAALTDTPHPHILYLESSHASVVQNVLALEKHGAIIELLPLKDTAVDCDKLESLLRDETTLVVCDAVCGETGVVWNTREIRTALDKHYRTKSTRPIFHIDASQAVQTEKITRAHFGADTITFDAAKVGPVRGAGVLIAARTLPLTPLYYGGGQERGMRSGSEAVDTIETFAEYFSQTVRNREKFRTEALRLRAELRSSLEHSILDLIINEGRTQAPHLVNISLPGRDTDYLVALLNERGFAISTRSACESDSSEGSRAVFALFGDRDRARSTLRISWGPHTKKRNLMRFARALTETVNFVDNTSFR